jgi:hypothetical protein
MIWTYETAFEQLERCDFECEGGPLENNAAYIWLKGELAKPSTTAAALATPVSGKGL